MDINKEHLWKTADIMLKNIMLVKIDQVLSYLLEQIISLHLNFFIWESHDCIFSTFFFFGKLVLGLFMFCVDICFSVCKYF